MNELKEMDAKDANVTANELGQESTTWTTRHDKATRKQMGYIAVFAKDAGNSVLGGTMDKSEASKKIEELKEKTGM
jgi:hypothetical protein